MVLLLFGFVLSCRVSDSENTASSGKPRTFHEIVHHHPKPSSVGIGIVMPRVVQDLAYYIYIMYIYIYILYTYTQDLIDKPLQGELDVDRAAVGIYARISKMPDRALSRTCPRPRADAMHMWVSLNGRILSQSSGH